MNYTNPNSHAFLLATAAVDFRSFVRLMWPVLNPTEPLDRSWHIDAISYVLEELNAERRRHQIINMPPRMLKSQLVSVLWPAFLLGQNPGTKIVVVSYADTLAEELSTQTRTVMQSEAYRLIFPDTVLRKQSSTHLTTSQGGKRYGTTIGGSITGIGADIIVIDDPLNATETYSQSARQQVKSYFRQTLLTRGNNPAFTRFVLVMQRLHEDDLSGHLLEQGGWRHLKLQAQATEDALVPIGNGEFHQVRAGDLLIPSRLPQSELNDLKQAMGSIEFQSQYQQEPAPADGTIIKRSWLAYGDPPSRDGGRVTLSLDAAVKTNPLNDYSVITVWLEKDGKHHLLHVWRERVEFPDLLRKIEMLRKHYTPDGILIEDAASGSALIQTGRRNGAPVIGRSCRDSKESRLVAVSSYFESGLVVLPKDAPWRADYETEILGFPGARHDDQVDSTTQYLLWIDEKPRGIFEVFWT